MVLTFSSIRRQGKCSTKFKFSLTLFFYLSQLDGSLQWLEFGWLSVSYAIEGELANMNIFFFFF